MVAALPPPPPPEQARLTEGLSRNRKSVACLNPGTSAPSAKIKGLAGAYRASRPLSLRSKHNDKGGRAPLSRKSSVPERPLETQVGRQPRPASHLPQLGLPTQCEQRLPGGRGALPTRARSAPFR
ncbi:microtubule-associated protein [Lynx pardinus]|uniref:Microtubule-associated protein n=1 Tax=Lynx pardinus TaxID=191816 RepID=A0A485MS24_LYNPA|nr:microtubule-associated protein [Lynx pardinus]